MSQHDHRLDLSCPLRLPALQLALQRVETVVQVFELARARRILNELGMAAWVTPNLHILRADARLLSVRQVCAEDTLALVVTERANLPVLAPRGYRGLDQLRSRLIRGEKNVIIRLH